MHHEREIGGSRQDRIVCFELLPANVIAAAKTICPKVQTTVCSVWTVNRLGMRPNKLAGRFIIEARIKIYIKSDILAIPSPKRAG
jgi:hypothetical protein